MLVPGFKVPQDTEIAGIGVLEGEIAFQDACAG
jgi:hypothetical protein